MNDEEFEDAVESLGTTNAPSSVVKPTRLQRIKKLTLRKSPGRDGQPSPVSPVPSPVPEAIPLGVGLEASHRAVDMFLNNDFDGSKRLLEPLADKSIYHALGFSVIVFLEAVMTFEQDLIEEAIVVLSQTCETIASHRRKNGGLMDSLGKLVMKRSEAEYKLYTETEAHAELCYAEVLLLRAILTLCEDETMVSFVKAGLKVRSCFQSFRDCRQILRHRNWENPQYKSDFESGVRYGIGSFHLMISLLPGRIMKLLEFIGFGVTGNSGLDDLMTVQEDQRGLRQFMASISLLGYQLFLTHFLGARPVNFPLAAKILSEKLERYPNGVFFLFYKGRYHLVQGQQTEAAKFYKLACKCDWQQLHHVCYWELIWCHQFDRNWRAAIEYAGTLFEESKWSKTFYAYLKAAIMCMLEEELSEDERKEQIQLMTNAPSWKQRIAGKSIPMEKFAIAKAKRFQEQGNHLTLPVMELMYLWNGFKIVGKSFTNTESFYVLVEDALKHHKTTEPDHRYKMDNYCLLMLLQGMCLKHMKSPLQAQECFKDILSYANKLKGDNYLVPYAMFEYSLLLREEGDLQTAMELLDHAKKDHNNYHFQSRLHFRIHAVQSDMKENIKKVTACDSAAADLDAEVAEDCLEFLDAETGEEELGLATNCESNLDTDDLARALNNHISDREANTILEMKN